MKWIIYWLGLMIILPLLCLFWWKKGWRLLFGVIILAVSVISYIAPGEITYSILATETEKEKPLQQLKDNLEKITDYEPKPADSEQVKLEKSIVKSRKEIEKGLGKEVRGEKLSEEEIRKLWNEYYLYLPLKQSKWVEKWGKKEKAPALLFCGEEFNEQLAREKKFVKQGLRTVENYNIIDFGKEENDKVDVFRKKLQEICQQENNRKEKVAGTSPIIWFKNIDKITNSELKKEFLKAVDPNQNTNLGKYQAERKIWGKTEQIEENVDLSQFTLVATTFANNPQLAPELKTKLKHIEPFFDKYFWILFFASGFLEIVIFLLLIRSRRKSKNKSLKHLKY